MAHDYSVDSVTVQNDLATLTGSVDGNPVTINFWWSALASFGPVQKRLFVAALMLAAAFPPSGNSDGSLLGRFTQ
jgi:hypothetical protein